MYMHISDIEIMTVIVLDNVALSVQAGDTHIMFKHFNEVSLSLSSVLLAVERLRLGSIYHDDDAFFDV